MLIGEESAFRYASDKMVLMRNVALAAAWILGAAGLLAAREYGPAADSRMPDFSLRDQDGKTHTLQSLLGPKGAVILFFRSADWCPYCKAQLVELEKNKAEFDKLGLGVAAVSYDSVAVLHNFAERRGIHFPLLSDQDSKTIRELNILNDTIAKDSAFFGIPFPGSFVLDAQGRIAGKYFEDDFKERYTSADILSHQFGVSPAASKTEVEGRQLRLTVSAGNSVVAAGQRVALALDIDLKPNMHVYAPGVEGYISIDWKMKETDAAAAHEVAYPQSEKLYLQAIDETVPVYRNHLRLTRDITIAQEAKLKPLLDSTGAFSVEGTLRYQACDDRLCYVPQELPVKWTFQLENFDRQRVPVELQRKAPAAQ